MVATSHQPNRSISGATTNPRLADYKVLVVDDTIVNLKVMDRMLRRIGVRNVTILDSGAKALGFLEKEPVGTYRHYEHPGI